MLFTSLLAAFASAELAVGVYQAPTPDQARSPCPAFNTAANHGYLPRDGTTPVPTETVVALFEELYGVDQAFIRELFQKGAELKVGDGSTINLVQLRLHNAIEHDVSMFHDDLNLIDVNGESLQNNYSVNQTLVEEMVNTSSDGIVMSDSDFVRFRRKRYNECKANDPALQFGLKEQVLAFAEVALLSKVIGAGNKPRLDQLRAFVSEERLPYEEGWTKSQNIITKASLLAYALKLRLTVTF